MDIKMKKCKGCEEMKPVDCFNVRTASKDGLQYRCTSCDQKYRQSKKGKASLKKGLKKWLKKPNGKMYNRLKCARRRTQIKQNGVEYFSYEDLRMFWLGQNILDDRCYYCLKSLPDGPEHIDHYIPVAKGGSHTKVNLRPSCACCNFKKNDKHPIQFMKEINNG